VKLWMWNNLSRSLSYEYKLLGLEINFCDVLLISYVVCHTSQSTESISTITNQVIPFSIKNNEICASRGFLQIT